LFFKKNSYFDETKIESIVEACLQENTHAQKLLVKMHLGFAKSIAMRYASNIEEAEEITNDAFLKMFNHLNRYDPLQPFKAWFRTIVVNTAIDSFRKQKKFLHQVDIDQVDVEYNGVDIFSKISADEILKLVQELPPSYRMVFSLYVIDGYNHREIADMLGIKEGTSKSNLQDARRKLQLMIKKQYPYLYNSYSFINNKLNEQ
jgi:RNA polymerase sigma-70 factor (ECF subfamily)